MRGDVDLTRLRVSIWEERETLYLPLANFRPRTPRTLVDLAGVRESIALTIDDDQLGRILTTPAAHFLRAFHLGINLVSTQREVTADRPGKEPVRFSVPVTSKPSPTVLTGTPKPETMTDLLRKLRDEEQQKHFATSGDEIWFSRDVDRAQDELRNLLKRATRLVCVVDYFFQAPDAGILLPAIGSLHVAIRVLTSRERGVRDSTDAVLLQRTVERLRDQLGMQPIDVRAMPGTEAEIHDRFLAIDDDVYLLGSSVNNFGARGTMLVRLRAPEVVQDAIEAAWNRARPLAELIQDAGPP